MSPIDELNAALERGRMTEAAWFAGAARIFAEAYPAADGPRGQSGFHGDARAWRVLRKPIADAIDADGSVLDVGCADGLLLEALARWSPHRLELHGLELVPELADLARRRLGHRAAAISVGNVLTWRPLCRYASRGERPRPLAAILAELGSDRHIRSARAVPSADRPPHRAVRVERPLTPAHIIGG